jgi:hypothetical protein
MLGIGPEYPLAMKDPSKNDFDGAKTYKITLPRNIPEAIFWSFTRQGLVSSLAPLQPARTGRCKRQC